ncbi:O-antigen ligase family protein [Anaerostipes sp. MSJ-23]|uniref:O-antigen ligase family protein n=1 Tax=Anaerostipes sp. MSJ-23 TaxID=2841520 RepID=UPI001C1088FA|nr:O-antigen ligase family protein [Anaerostipes sp. MSJ-23]MBU5459680.1 O-antigen ligase family protein [Anaerostipes sp. MSJ-23]
MIKRESIKKIGIWILLFFSLTVDFRITIFKNTYVAYIFAIFGLMCLLYGSYTKIKVSQRLSFILWCFAAIFVIVSLDLGQIIGFFVGLILLYCYYQSGGAKEYTVRVIFFYGVFYAFFTFFFYFNPSIYVNIVVPKFADYARQTALNMITTHCYPGLTAHYSTNGIYLAMGIGAIYSIYLSNSLTKVKKRFVILAMAFVLGALLLTGKRAHLVFSIASCFIVYWISNKEQKGNRLLKIILIAIIISVVFEFAVNLMPALSNTFQRFEEATESGDMLMGRNVMYVASWKKFLENPIFGCGWKNMSKIVGHDSHNIYLQLLAETGIVGFVLFVGLILYGVITATKVLNVYADNKSKYVGKDGILLYFASFYVYFFTIYGMTGNPLYDEQTFNLFMISYGAILFYQKRIKNNYIV